MAFNGKLAVGLISFNRPHYFKRVIEHLEAQTHHKNTDFYLFQDGHKNAFSGKVKAKRSEIESCIYLFEGSRLREKFNLANDLNYGNALNQFSAKEYLSSRYAYFLLVEDDTLLSKDYLRLCRIVIGQNRLLSDRVGDKRIASFNLGFHRQAELNEDNLSKLIVKLPLQSNHWWAECFISECWQEAREHFLKYLALVKNVDYTDRNHKQIKEFFESEGFAVKATSQDAGKDYAYFKSNFCRLTALINRGYNIGETGLHFTPEKYQKMKFGRQKPYIHESDKMREHFSIQQ